MTLYTIWELCNYIAGRYPNGSAITPSRFNELLPMVQWEFYSDRLKAKDWETLRPFRKTAGDGTVGLVTSGGVAALPSDYNVFEAAYYMLGEDPIRVHMVDDQTWNMLITHATEYPDLKHPICKTQGEYLYFRPTQVNHIVFSYLTKPADPVFDYVVDATNPSRVMMLPTGAVLSEQQTDVYNVLLNGSVLTTGVMKDGGYDGYVSNTVELLWPESVHYILVYMLLQKVGINLSESEVVKYSLAMAAKE